MNLLRRSVMDRPLAAGIVITVVTIALAGGIVMTGTRLGCTPAQKVGLKLQQCVSATPVAGIQSPSPAALSPLPPAAYPSANPNPNPNPASNPYPYPVSGPYPNPVSGPEPPAGQPASGAYPPFYPAASSPKFPMPYPVSCRLPIYSGQSGSGGFIVFPGRTYVADPSSAVALPSPGPGASPPPLEGPGGPQFFGLSYDRPYSRWLAVPYSWIAPGGSRYAFPTTDAIYVEDLAAGTLTALGKGHAWSIVGVQSAGVYAVQPNTPGLWLLPLSGPATELVTGGWWQAVSADAAYGTDTSAVPPGVANTILRYDLKAGTTRSWFTRDGAQSTVTGFDAFGNAILTVFYVSAGNEVWVTTPADEPIPLTGSQGEGYSLDGNPLGDAHGIWIPLYYPYVYGGGGFQVIALYVAGQGVYGMSTITGQLAGPCV